MKRNYENIGVHVPEILLPSSNIDLAKWSVVACDQYTSQPAYWNDVIEITGENPSTLQLIFPEIYLKDEDIDIRIKNINQSMDKFITEKILEPQKPGFILVDRSTSHSPSRKGLIVALDLEKYDYKKGSKSLIRATEGTVLDRIPPRVKIRENARIELPHIMVLIDDPKKTVIEPLFDKKDKFEKVYDFELMKNGGHLKGWKINDEEYIGTVLHSLEQLALDKLATNTDDMYNCKGTISKGTVLPKTLESSPREAEIYQNKDLLLFAVGDGNHSLATAKAHWENIKSNQNIDSTTNNPARYALVELVNVHDDGIIFEPIHRVLFNINSKTILEELVKYSDMKTKLETEIFDNEHDMRISMKNNNIRKLHSIPFRLEGKYGLLKAYNPSHNLEVGTLQAILDNLVENNKQIEMDYIHGDDVVTELGSKNNKMGFYLPAMNKNDLFKTVILEGALPRKTFSMGEAEEKRYYLECRKIK